MPNLQKILQEKFKLEEFREGQLEIIESVIAGNDTLVFMPTGGGKSLTYQFPGVMRPGLVIIISPLISLMKDQVDKLNELGLRTEFINSSIGVTDKRFILDEISQNMPDEVGGIKFLYIAPERLNDEHFLRVIQSVDISLIAIDEAHCISQWGHDFRPSYMKIKGFIDSLRQENHFPIIALTATATKKVRADIVERLGLKNYHIFTKGFDRKNLVFIVREITKKEEKLKKVLEIIKKTPPYGIVYCSSIKAVKEVYDFLKEEGINAGIYTGEMNANSRESEQNNFMNSSYDVIVATNAFGMGIDKKDIRYVIHYNLPGSIENYYQEAGRAGRDRKTSYSIIIASYQDTIIQEFFIENAYPPKEDILKLYDYFYKDFKLGEGVGIQILKTYAVIAKESGINGDMKVGSIIRIFEKYGIVKRGFDTDDNTSDFRGRGITLLLGKKTTKDIPILWNHQDVLKNESYFKLEQIKKLLFKPGCRKRFILEYFGDEEDLRNLGETCGVCDYCLDKKKLKETVFKEIVPTNVFFIVLEFIKKLDEKFGANILASVLVGSKEKKITEWNLDLNPDYAILEEYNKDIVMSVFEVLIDAGYLYKSAGQYPKIGLSERGRLAIFSNNVLLDEKDELHENLFMKASRFLNKEKEAKKEKVKKLENVLKIEKIDTLTQTEELYDKGLSIEEIATQRELTKQTIEGHIVSLYSLGKIPLQKIMKISELEKLKFIKDFLLNSQVEINKLSEIKTEIDKKRKDISYLDIKVCLAMIEKKDI
nr:RecQ family ATP-dependent DNA helicase [Candidatus Gracilibacteria bacterium]